MSDSNRKTPLPLAVLISGGGTTLRNLIQRIETGRLDAEIKLVISSNPRARGLEFATEADIPAATFQRKDFAGDQAFSEAIFERCRDAGAELVVMAGFLKFLPVPPDFENRVMNIHPALIPAFCGQGMYGLRVHEAVLAYGVKATGCTVHFVDNVYDHGPIILQRVVPVHQDDDAESLQRRVFATECEAYPEAIALYAADRLRVDGRLVRIANTPQ